MLLFSENALNKQVVEFFEMNYLDSKFVDSIKKIDFSYELEDKDCETLGNTLGSISKDICDINALSELLQLDIGEFWSRQFRGYLDKQFFIYERKIYQSLKGSNADDKARFLENRNYYKNFELGRSYFQNSILVNLDEIA